MGNAQKQIKSVFVKVTKLCSVMIVILVCQFIFGFGCNKFQSVDLQSLADGDGPLPGLGSSNISQADGQKVYDSTCVACHGSIVSTTISGKTVDSINSALSNIPQMQGLKDSLSQADILAVSKLLSGPRTLPQCKTAEDPGFVNIHRLNNIEYDNTVSDLLGTSTRFSEEFDFTPDESAKGFLNNAEIINTTGAQSKKFFEAAKAAINEVFSRSTLKDRILTCNPDQESCVRSTLQKFLLRAFRRPPTEQEVANYVAKVNLVKGNGDSAELGVKVAMTAALSSPHFLYRVPQHPQPENVSKVVNLNAYELASRLSYFIWSTMPDEELFSLAASGSLHEDMVLETQVQRMMKDSKAKSLVDNFVVQWVGLSKLNDVMPDPQMYSSFSEDLRRDMMTETRLFFQDLFERDGSFYELLNAKHTFVNRRLASLYGLNNVSGDEFQKVSIPSDMERQGILTQPSLLAIASGPKHGSIVQRGNFILTDVLCSPPPPPPPDTPELMFEDIENSTRRAALEQHRSNPACYSCHAQLDPLGLGYENFDALGQYMTQDEVGRPIDSTGQFPDGSSFEGPVELANLLNQDQRFQTCVAEKLFTYGLGRGVKSYDRCTINRIGLTAVDPSKPVSAAIIGIIKSDAFRKQRGAGGQ